MSAYVMDSQLFGNQFSTAEMREIFSDRMTVQKWPDVESALACAEAEAGVIPVETADEIVRVADADLYDLAAMKDEMDRTSHPIIPLVRAVAMADTYTGELPHKTLWIQDKFSKLRRLGR